MYNKNGIEILSPCGGPESLSAAMRTGADAVYLGYKDFSARHNAVNFSLDELRDAVRECHRHGVLIYLALNISIFDDELEDVAEIVELACSLPVDAIIASDLALLSIKRSACPKLNLHASTQMTIHTPLGAKLAANLGYSRVVAARELSLSALKAMADTGVEIEAFAHGALCMCVSGQCYLSAMIGSRSANRGLCAGACRLPFSANGVPDGDYALSLKDMSYCGFVEELRGAGIKSLKIEGRMKRPEYVAAATDALRSAADGKPFDAGLLRDVFSRSGFTDGYLTEHLGAVMFGARQKEDVTAAAEALPKLRRLYDREEKRFALDLKLTAKLGESVTIAACDGKNRTVIASDPPEPAINRETSAEEVIKQLSKLGGTLYEPGAIEADIGSGVSLPVSKINGLRRKAVEALDNLRIDNFAAEIPFDSSALRLGYPQPRILKHPRFCLRIERAEQLSKIDASRYEITAPLWELERTISYGVSPDMLTAELPRFVVDEDLLLERIEFAKTLGVNMVECNNLSHIAAAKAADICEVGGFGFNITNSVAVNEIYQLGLERLTLSPELKCSQLNRIGFGGELGFEGYGRLPLMVTRNCPIAAQTGCKNCTRCLIDRTGAKFPILCRRDYGYYELINSRALWLADKLSDFNLDYCVLRFTTESADEVAEVIECYVNGRASGGEFTRGLYYRGVR